MAARMRRAVTAGVLAVLAAASGALVEPGTAHAETIRGREWWLTSLDIAQAQQVSGAGQGVVVAVLDSGVYAQHPDLTGQVLPGTGIGTGSAADGRADQDGHGTWMASVIVAKGGGNDHMLGVAPKATVLPISNGVSTTTHDIAQSIRWAADHGAKVINISEGGVHQPPDEMIDAVHYALGKDVVIVASAGNTDKSHTTQVADPADIPGVIAVSATDKSNTLWSSSAHGPQVVLAAPGVSIVGASPPDPSASSGYVTGDGTSPAAAIVSGVAALVRAKYPTLDAANVINRLIRTAKDVGPSGRDESYGFGVVDPVSALTASVPTVIQNPLTGAAGAGPGSAPSLRSTERDQGAPIAIGVTNTTGAIVQASVCLALVIGLVALLVYLRRRSRRRTAAVLAAQPPPGWSPPPPPGWRPPPGHPGPPPWPGPPPTAQPPAGPPSSGTAPWPGQPQNTGYPPGQGPPPRATDTTVKGGSDGPRQPE